MKSILKQGVLIGLVIFVFSCAQIVSPTGGPKDSKAPRVLKYLPDSAAINFKAKNIVIYFDEFIQLKDLNSQLVVSPPVKKQPNVTVKNKTLEIELEEDLKDSTTYAISFGKAITDLTEGNSIDNFKYIFSTGAFIDSLIVKGKIDHAFNHKSEKDILVMLYSNLNDSAPFKEAPSYFAKTKEDGSFKITNVRKGKYRVFALKETNANYKYDAPEEWIGFSSELLNLERDTVVNISLFKENPKKQFIRKAASVEYGHLLFAFNKPVEDLYLEPMNFSAKTEWKMEEWNATKDTLNCWLIGVGSLDTLKLKVVEKSKVLDTVRIRTISKDQPSGKMSGRGNKFELTVKTNIGSVFFDLNQSINLNFNHPIKKINKTEVILKKDSAVIPNLYMETTIAERIGKLSFFVDNKPYVLEGEKKYQLNIPPGSYVDLFDLPNDTVKASFVTQELKFYGTLKLKLSIPKTEQSYILQLIDEKGVVCKENMISESKNIDYEYLKPQKYTIKIIYDDNKNGKWDTGNYMTNLQPEKTVFYLGTIEIRSNWDLEQEWRIEK